MKNMEEKTNAIRLVEGKKIKYLLHTYTSAISGIEVATALKQNPNHVFKTLVTVGKSNKNYVFLVAVCDELDLKKAAVIVKEKYVEMIKRKDLFPLTGYIHGGCSPIGMKKNFPVIIDEKALYCDTICFSGGKIGYQLEMTLDELKKVISFTIGNIHQDNLN